MLGQPADLDAELERFGPELLDLAMRDPEAFLRVLEAPRPGELQAPNAVKPKASRALSARMPGTP